MSNDQLFDDPDEVVVSRVQAATQIAVRARKGLEEAAHDAVESATIFGYELGAVDKEYEILDWIEANRTEVTDGVYRDHFTSEDLIAFIKGKTSET